MGHYGPQRRHHTFVLPSRKGASLRGINCPCSDRCTPGSSVAGAGRQALPATREPVAGARCSCVCPSRPIYSQLMRCVKRMAAAVTPKHTVCVWRRLGRGVGHSQLQWCDCVCGHVCCCLLWGWLSPPSAPHPSLSSGPLRPCASSWQQSSLLAPLSVQPHAPLQSGWLGHPRCVCPIMQRSSYLFVPRPMLRQGCGRQEACR
jgi:hypothetical protein